MGSINVGRLVGWGILALLVVAGVTVSRPDGRTPDVPDDAQAREALALVQSHPARNAPTLGQAMDEYVDGLDARGIPFHRGAWQVGKEHPGVYAVRTLVREHVSSGWIEREFAWRVTLEDRMVRVISLAAIHMMPFHQLPPLPHQDQIS